jgi:hypothetical protein
MIYYQAAVVFLRINYMFPPKPLGPRQDGCDFVCRSRPREEVPTYRGGATEPLDEEEQEERDDHLLPM